MVRALGVKVSLQMSDTNGPEAAPPEVSYVLDSLKTSFDEEFKTGESLTNKVRQVFALAAAYFTVVQTVAFSSFLHKQVKGPERPILLATAALAILCLGIAAVQAARADSPIPTH